MGVQQIFRRGVIQSAFSCSSRRAIFTSSLVMKEDPIALAQAKEAPLKDINEMLAPDNKLDLITVEGQHCVHFGISRGTYQDPPGAHLETGEKHDAIGNEQHPWLENGVRNQRALGKSFDGLVFYWGSAI